MGLNEKRKLQELKDVVFPERTKELLEISGAPIVYVVDWASLEEYDALNFIDNVSCHRINMALRGICHDQLGKDAVKGGLKKITLTNVKELTAKSLRFAGGVLELRCAYAQGLSGAFSDGEIQKVLEAGL